MQASQAVDRVRQLLRRKGTVSPDRLREPRIAWGMLEAWSDAVSAYQTPPRLVNTDGEEILLTEDRWTLPPSKREEVLQRIATIENSQPEEDGVFVILQEGNQVHADWDNTIIAHLRVSESELRASTNSISRADVLRARIEEACGPLLSAGTRSHTDPTSAGHDPSDTSAPTPNDQALVLELKQQHYARWLNDPIPALDGKTPHEAARTKSGRERLGMILSDIELMESQAPDGARFAVDGLRRVLGLMQ